MIVKLSPTDYLNTAHLNDLPNAGEASLIALGVGALLTAVGLFFYWRSGRL